MCLNADVIIRLHLDLLSQALGDAAQEHIYFLTLPEDIFFIAFREREREEEERVKKTEKHQWEREALIGCLLYMPRLGI